MEKGHKEEYFDVMYSVHIIKIYTWNWGPSNNHSYMPMPYISRLDHNNMLLPFNS